MAFSLAYKRTWKTSGASYVYVDSWGGDDLLGDGSADKPFQTINRAQLKSGSYVLKGYFSEQVNSNSRAFYSDFLGDAIYDGKGIYSIGNAQTLGGGNMAGIVLINTVPVYGTMNASGNNIIVNVGIPSAYSPINGSYSVHDNISYNGANATLLSASTQTNSAFLNMTNTERSSYSVSGATKCIYDNCKIYLDAQLVSGSAKVDTCLFRGNCTFWVRNSANNGDIRIDANGQTAAQKYAAVMNWLSNGTATTGYFKLPWVNCKITDSRIFNKPDEATDGYNFDYSLIYGDKDSYPACYMDGGRHIGPFPPAIKIAFKATADLSSSPFEIEVKPTDKVSITGDRIELTPDFNGCILLSKPMPVPVGTNFNNINLCVIPDTENRGVFVTPFQDAIDFSEASKISPTVTGVPLSGGIAYFVKAGSAYVTYAGNTYQSGSVITAVDSTTLCYKSAGDTATLHPIFRPTIWNGVMMKISESRDCPSDFLANDTAYPWIDCKSSHSSGASTDAQIGMRCLRVGNLASGAIDVGTDGKPLTSAHPEFYSTANSSRAKFLIAARWVILRLAITKYN